MKVVSQLLRINPGNKAFRRLSSNIVLSNESYFISVSKLLREYNSFESLNSVPTGFVIIPRTTSPPADWMTQWYRRVNTVCEAPYDDIDAQRAVAREAFPLTYEGKPVVYSLYLLDQLLNQPAKPGPGYPIRIADPVHFIPTVLPMLSLNLIYAASLSSSSMHNVDPYIITLPRGWLNVSAPAATVWRNSFENYSKLLHEHDPQKGYCGLKNLSTNPLHSELWTTIPQSALDAIAKK